MGPRRLLGVVLATGALFGVASSPAAAQPKLEVDTADNPLVITQLIPEDGKLTGTIRIHALEEITKLRALFSDLKSAADPLQNIPRSRLSLTGADSLAKDDFVDAEVGIAGVKTPGVYKGQVELVPQGAPRADAVTVKIEVHALSKPALTPIAPHDGVRGKLTRCGWAGCGATDWLVPGSAGAEARSVKFSVAARQQPTVSAIEVIGQGEDSGHELTTADLGLDGEPSAHVSQNGDILSVKTNIDPDKLEPDSYKGTLRITVDNLDEPVSAPIDFTVRNEPIGAIVALLVGLLLGLLTKYMGARGGELLAAYKRASLLEGRVRAMADGAQKTTLIGKLADARAALDRGDLAQANGLLKQVEDSSAPAVGAGGADAALVGGPSQSGFSISRLFSLQVAAFLVRLVLLVAALFVGFQLLYVNEGTTFGSDAVFSYAALVVWGISADIASRQLASLAGRPATAGG